VHLRSLVGRGIDYLALGHIHTYGAGKIDARGTYAYAGCLEPRGFDELGEKGFVVIDTSAGVEHSFMGRSMRTVKLETLDVSGMEGIAEVLQKASELPIERENMLRILLMGEADFDTDGIEGFLTSRLRDKCFALSVKDETEKALHIEKYEGQVCVEWEFIKLVQANTTLTEKQKKEVISMGLKALKGERL
jgi:DNA repair exonuclease SbcCD nuclease subunit